MQKNILQFFEIFAITVFSMVSDSYGQDVIEKIEDSKTKKTSNSECNLSNYELDHIFKNVEILANFKGLSNKWFEYAQNNFDFQSFIMTLPDSVQQFHDSISIRFIVTKAGKVCDVQIVGGNNSLAKPVVNLIKNSPPWTPASSGGRYLNAYRILKVEVMIDRLTGELKIIRNIDSFLSAEG